VWRKEGRFPSSIVVGQEFDLSAYTVFGILLIVLMFLMTTGNVGGVYMVMRR